MTLIYTMMSLRVRLMASIAAALVLSLVLGAGLAWWRAAHSVERELVVALDVGERAVRADAPAAEPSRLVASFDGERHLIATLRDAQGGLIQESHSAADRPVPGWFVWLVAPAIPPRVVALAAGAGTIVLQAAPANEAGEAWAALCDSAAQLLVFSTVAGALTLVVAGHALRPLEPLAAALDGVGPGRYGVRVPAAGPSDLHRLAIGFNRMAQRLEAIEVQNERLGEQVLTIQDEERADLARDLHDDVGPFLFSIQVGTAAAERLAAASELAALPAQLALIREDAGHAQKHVRAVLARLRPLTPATLGLASAIEDLAQFWGARNPAVAIDLVLGPGLDDAADPAQDVAYRVAQEALSNALRHGRPQRISIAAAMDANVLSVQVGDDGETPAVPGRPGFGLEAMRQRVASLGGTLQAGPAHAGNGWVVVAALPGRAGAG